MKLLSISEIVVRSRQRKSMTPAALNELKLSIMQRGLLHAPVVRFEGKVPVLVAGERRLTAIKTLAADGIGFVFDRENIPAGTVPVIELEDRGEIANREAELEENIRREDLSWQDKVAAINELHQLRSAQNPGQTKITTGAELAAKTGQSVETTRKQVDRATIIAEHLNDPDVQRAGSEGEAFKIVSRKMDARFTSMLAAQTSNQASDHLLLQASFLAVNMNDYPDIRNFSCIIADPPYGMGADSFGDAATMKHSYSDTPEVADQINRHILQMGYHIAQDQAHLYLFCDMDNFIKYRDLAANAGWKPLRTPLIWVKGSQGHVPDQSIGVRRTYESILFATKGGKGLSHITNDTILIPPESEKLHAAQKPVELYRFLLARSCLPGDRVLDPCCGSGTIFKAAHELRLRATGVEINEQYASYARAAIAGLVSTPTGVASL